MGLLGSLPPSGNILIMIKMKRMTTAFIALLMTYAAAFGSPTVYNVLDYGAVGDTTTLSTKAIQRAIDDCHGNGGGTVWVPAGNYLSTAIVLKDNVTFHLDAGATIFASRRLSDYEGHKIPMGATDMQAVEVLLMARDAENISVTGTGALHCQAVRESYQRKPVTAVTDSVTGREVFNAAKYGADYLTKFRKVPPCPGAINFTGCTNVHISGIQVIESSGWSVHLQWCDRVYVDGIHIRSSGENGVNSDGLDIDGCSNVMISDCVINTGDDALCLKTTKLHGESRPCQWITINNCILTSSSAALKLGTESHDDFENITVSNCVINNANRGLNMIIRDGGSVRNVSFSNIIINTVRKATFWWGNGDPLWFTVQKRKGAAKAGSIENVTIHNIIARGQSGVRMEAFDGPIENIRIRDFQLFMEPEPVVDKRARNGFLFHGVDGLSMIDCQVGWNKEQPQEEWESAYYFEDVTGLEMVRVKGEAAPNGRFDAFRYVNCEK